MERKLRRTSSSTPSSSIKIGGFVGSISIVSPGLRTVSPALAGVMTVYEMVSADWEKTKETAYWLTSHGSIPLMSCGVDNIIVPIATCRRGTSINDDRFEPIPRSTVSIKMGIMWSRRPMRAVGPHALVGMTLHAVRLKMGGGASKAATHTCSSRTSGGMVYAAMVVDNRSMACNRGGSLTNRGIPARWSMEGYLGVVRRPVKKSSKYCRGSHTPVSVVVNMDLAWGVYRTFIIIFGIALVVCYCRCSGYSGSMSLSFAENRRESLRVVIVTRCIRGSRVTDRGSLP